MVQKDIRPFVPTSNVNLLNAIRLDMSPEYQARIPEATDASIDKTLNELFKYKNHRNEFVDALVNQIGLIIVRNKNWSNPLAKFKKGLLEFGDSVEEIQTGLVKAKTYNGEREHLERDIFGVEKVDVQSAFHRINRQDWYKVTVNDSILRRAFTSANGLSQFIADLMAVPSNSDNLDEFHLMTGLLRKHYDRGGFFKQRVADVAAWGSTESDAKTALRKVRAMAGNLTYMSTHYNPAHMPTFAERDDLELIVTPEFSAAVDVEALAGAFNAERAAMPGRQTEIRKEDINVPGFQAALVTKDFWQVYDTLFQTETSRNPAGLVDNVFLHHHQIISLSRFSPAVLFTSTENDTAIVINDTVLTAIGDITLTKVPEGTVALNDLARGSYYQVHVTPTTTPANQPYALLYSVEGVEGEFTKITQDGLLFVGIDESAADLTIRVQDPAKDVADKTLTVTLSGDVARVWPNPAVIPEADAEADDE